MITDQAIFLFLFPNILLLAIIIALIFAVVIGIKEVKKRYPKTPKKG